MNDRRTISLARGEARAVLGLRLRSSVCSLIIHELQLSSVPSTTLNFISTHTEQ